MTSSNPFAPPLAALADDHAAIDAPRLHRVAAARRRVLAGMHLSFCLLAFQGAPLGMLMLAILSAAVTGRAVVGLHAALDDPRDIRILTVAAMLLPLINLGVMAALVWRASKLLRAHVRDLPPFDPLRR